MNAGLSNLATLKRELLLPTDVEDTDYDPSVIAYGIGVLGLFERLCNREFAYVEAEVREFSAYREQFVLPRYPVAEVISLEVRESLVEGWQAVDAVNVNRMSGLLFFDGKLGSAIATARVTYSGGFWFDSQEPTDEGFPAAMPTGAYPVPDGLRLAWFQQCKFFWDRKGTIENKKAIFDKEGIGYLGSEVEILPTVKATLDSYRRFQCL